MKVSIERLMRARKITIRIVRERPDGRRYVSVVLRLEQEIANLRGLDNDYARLLGEAS